MGSLRGLALLILLPFALPGEVHAEGCAMPDEGGRPLRRAVSRIKHLPQTEAWAAQAKKAPAVVQYVLSLDEPRIHGGRCYWPVEVRADGKLWKRFLVTPDGRRVLEDGKS